MQCKTVIRLALLILVAGALVAAIEGGQWFSIEASNVRGELVSGKPTGASVRADERYPYRSRRFTSFVDESYGACNAGSVRDYYGWMDKTYNDSHFRYPGREKLGLEALLRARKQDIGRISDVSKKTKDEIDTAAWVHRLVKKIIPKFSLDRGFEFCNVVRTGERQCFLQSVLIAGLLQDMGMDAGVAMVYKNIGGEETNNGHAITLLKLPNGEDIIVDASEPEPFARHRGLFVRTSDYAYVEPAFEKSSPKISYYRTAAHRSRVDTAEVRTLDYDFLRSQFWYYRGERAKGGLLWATPTKEGLESAASSLRMSVKLCPSNPLSVFTLGRVYQAQRNAGAALREFRSAYKLYSRFGWIPDGPKDYLASAQRPHH
jgi:hypothetical protein